MFDTGQVLTVYHLDLHKYQERSVINITCSRVILSGMCWKEPSGRVQAGELGSIFI